MHKVLSFNRFKCHIPLRKFSLKLLVHDCFHDNTCIEQEIIHTHIVEVNIIKTVQEYIHSRSDRNVNTSRKMNCNFVFHMSFTYIYKNVLTYHSHKYSLYLYQTTLYTC